MKYPENFESAVICFLILQITNAHADQQLKMWFLESVELNLLKSPFPKLEPKTVPCIAHVVKRKEKKYIHIKNINYLWGLQKICVSAKYFSSMGVTSTNITFK